MVSNTEENPFKKEQCTLATILVFFELGFLSRFVWDAILAELLFNEEKWFAICMVYDLIAYLEGLSFSALLLFHRNNFKSGASSESL